jgi:hypothetical protein
MAEVKLDDITDQVMDRAARKLGAPDHKAFLSAAPTSMVCAFRLICELIVENDRLQRRPDQREQWLAAGRPVSAAAPLCGL